MSLLGLILLFQFLFISGGSSRNLLYPCGKAESIYGLDFVNVYSKFSLESVIKKEILVKVAPWLGRTYISVNCSWRGLTKIPQNLPANVEGLVLQSNVIKQIRANDFLFFPNITLLTLYANCIPSNLRWPFPPCSGDLYIEPGTFQHLVHLKWLGLAGNYLREFPRQLPLCLKGLDISFTMLGDVSAQLQRLNNLTMLFGIRNCESPTELFCPRNFTITQPLSSSLKVINLSNNGWRKIPSYLLGDQLEALSIAANHITRLRKGDFTNATSLELLDVSVFYKGYELLVDDSVFDPLEHLKFLNLSYNFIQHLPNGIFNNNKNLEILDLSFNCLQRTIFEPTYLANLCQLRHVDLSSNNLGYPFNINKTKPIELLRLGQTFASLSSLQTLIFGNGGKLFQKTQFSVQFHVIDNQSFASLSNLTHLSTIDISYCNVHRISSDAWSALRHLKSIRASNNRLTFDRSNLKEETFSNLQTKKLKNQLEFFHHFPTYVENHQLSGPFDFECDNNYNLQQKIEIFRPLDFGCYNNGLLDYSNNQIATISEKKTLLLSMTTILNLSHNKISEIRSDDLKHLIYLCSIDLSYNVFKKIDHLAFVSLSNLRQIDFVLKDVDPNVGFDFLCKLNFSAQIKFRWKMFDIQLFSFLVNWNRIYHNCKASSVMELNIAHNDLRAVGLLIKHGVLQFMPELRYLVLSGCNIFSPVSDDWFHGLSHLERLDMSHNNLALVPSTALRTTTKLHVLNLDHNNIIELMGNLSFLTDLKELTIAHNKLRFIHPGFFLHLKLKSLDLSYNEIRRLDPSILNKVMLDSLLYLDIRWNQLDCSCNIWEQFYRWYVSDASDNTKLPGFYPKCTLEIDQYFGGCVACQSPQYLCGRSVSRYGFNTSCDLQKHLKYTIAFTVYFILFCTSGIIGYSKWFKRLIFRKVNEYFRVQSLKPSDDIIRQQTFENKGAFVFFDHNNDKLGDWVDNNLVPGMINGNLSIELLLAGRDIEGGSFSMENLLRLVLKSRKTIVIFSGSFCETPICRFVLTALQELQYSAGRDQLILVEWHSEEAARVPELIQRTFNRKFYNFLRFHQTNDDEVMFFETLRTALASSVILGD
ncbi:toll-like receptor 7 isoform X1 [Clavelina lepadiformis]|uniref:toll-like receptor 7 isoform X1 n=1 Tax=Clavelina lepadiformis TaxID=159417 RepID=UPI004041A1E2